MKLAGDSLGRLIDPKRLAGAEVNNLTGSCDSFNSLNPKFRPLWITHSTVTDFARFLGWSTSVPFNTAT